MDYGSLLIRNNKKASGIGKKTMKKNTLKCCKKKIPNLESLFQQNCRSKMKMGTSLLAQWLGVRLPIQGTRVRALVWEDPACRGATRPVRHTAEPALQSLRATTAEPMLGDERSHPNKSTHCNKEYPRLAAAGESLRAATNTQRSQK